MVDVTYARPALTLSEAVELAEAVYGLRAAATPLPGERDQNVHLRTEAGDAYVLKIANVAQARAALELQNHVLGILNARVSALSTPRVVPTTAGNLIATIAGTGGGEHAARLLTFVPGRLWAHVHPHSPELLHSLGRTLGLVDAALQDLPRPEEAGELKWDLAHAGWIRQHFADLTPDRRALVERLFAPYEAQVGPQLASLPAGLLHNDANDYNVLVHHGRVTGLIDYGDLVHGPRVCELAIGVAYAIMGKPDPLGAAAQIVAGYHEALPLTEAELALVYPLICARLCVSVTNSAIQRHADPANEYLLVSERPAWALLAQLDHLSPRLAHYMFRAACGLPPCPVSSAIVDWISRHPGQCGPIVEADLRTESVVFDLSVGSTEWGTLAELRDPAAFSRSLAERMRTAPARAGIGRYDEARLVYTADLFAVPGNDGPERRTVHLGMDVFVDAGSAVLAPLDGVVHSVADNAGALDCGPTIVVEHAPPDGPAFHTLYGHLSRESVRDLHAGQAVGRGQRIGAIGHSEVNGGWAPHLHFQIIADLLGHVGEFPGVAPASQRALWLSLSPDPNLILGIPRDRFPPPAQGAADIHASRRERLGPNLSLAYREPLHIVRGYMQHLYDADGRAYLDAVNNVPHVGHCHPRVVRAGHAQMAVLNTNSRYLHAGITRYAERLCATLPERLRVCYFVNSGSEANELALRLARAHTRSRGTVVLEGAYHGNTAALVEISPYKYDGPGGAGQPPVVRSVPMPDTYRGRHRRGEASAGERYAAEVAHAMEDLARSRPAQGGVHRRIAHGLLRSDRAARWLPAGGVPARARRGRRVHRRRGPGGVRTCGHPLLGLRHAGRRARHRGAGQADGERPSDWRGHHHAGDRGVVLTTGWSTSAPSAATRCRARSRLRCWT